MRQRTENVLVVEDDGALRDLLTNELDDRGYQVHSVDCVDAARQAFRQRSIDLVISDLRLPDGSGLDVLNIAMNTQPRPAVILITAFGSVPQAVEALKSGADDFLTKPLDLDHLGVRLERVLEHRRTNASLEALRRKLRHTERGTSFHGMVGESDVMQQLFAIIRQVANVDDPVLITGESGTGKELVAKAIHAESKRAKRAFVAINCASVPEALLEAEFFGHTANAFTGARSARAGLFAEADGGTLFLDEIGEMPAALQAKLLRAIQEGRVRPLGGAEEVPVDVRIIAATNRDIEADVRAGIWREDLYYRLETLSLKIPPLRRRGDDKLELTAHFLATLAAQRELPQLKLSEAALAAVRAYPFPGNVRELGNALARAATFCDDGLIDVQHLPARMRTQDTAPEQGHDPLGINAQPWPTLAQIEARYIRWVLERTGNNKKKAAEILDVGRRTVYRKLEEPGGNES